MLHISAVATITQGFLKEKPFNLKYVSSNGEIIEFENCIVTSSNFQRNTFNVKVLESSEIRTIRNVSIIEFNGKEVYI